MPIVAAPDDPVTVFLPHNLADVVRPNDDSTNGRTTGI
jgi:hypothetical protein